MRELCFLLLRLLLMLLIQHQSLLLLLPVTWTNCPKQALFLWQRLLVQILSLLPEWLLYPFLAVSSKSQVQQPRKLQQSRRLQFPLTNPTAKFLDSAAWKSQLEPCPRSIPHSCPDKRHLQETRPGLTRNRVPKSRTARWL